MVLKRSESEYDVLGAEHAYTAISALGMAEARYQKKKKIELWLLSVMVP